MDAPLILHDSLRPRTLFVSDLDGTLLNSSSQVSAESARMIGQAVAKGALFSVATARTPATVIPLLRDVPMRHPAVVMTGAALYNLSTYEFSRLQFMPEGVTERLLTLYRKHGVATFVYTFKDNRLDVYHIGALNDHERGFMAQRAHTRVKRFLVPASGESPLPPNLDNTVLLYSVQPWLPALSLYEEVKEKGLPVNPLCYHDNLGEEWGQLEMFSHTADKAKAVEALASDLRADRIVAFGDNVNDIPLFSLADEKIAVQGAVAPLKELATDIIGSNDSDAVASFILSRFS